jgi:hypothetical protein
MSILLNTAIESTPAPDFFEIAIQSRDIEILMLERELYTMRAIIEEQNKTIAAYRASISVRPEDEVVVPIIYASNSASVSATETVFATETVAAEESTEIYEQESTVDRKQKHRSLANYLVDEDRITHTLKDSEWCVYYDKEAGELIGTGGIYKSLRSFVIAHRAAINRPAKNIVPWNECKVLRNGTYIKMSELLPLQ